MSEARAIHDHLDSRPWDGAWAGKIRDARTRMRDRLSGAGLLPDGDDSAIFDDAGPWELGVPLPDGWDGGSR